MNPITQTTFRSGSGHIGDHILLAVCTQTCPGPHAKQEATTRGRIDYTTFDFHVVMQIKCLIFLYLPMLAADICENNVC